MGCANMFATRTISAQTPVHDCDLMAATNLHPSFGLVYSFLLKASANELYRNHLIHISVRRACVSCPGRDPLKSLILKRDLIWCDYSTSRLYIVILAWVWWCPHREKYLTGGVTDRVQRVLSRHVSWDPFASCSPIWAYMFLESYCSIYVALGTSR